MQGHGVPCLLLPLFRKASLALVFLLSLSLSLSPRATSTATPCYASARAAARNSEPGDEVRVLGDERRIIHEFLQAACCISGDASIA